MSWTLLGIVVMWVSQGGPEATYGQSSAGKGSPSQRHEVKPLQTWTGSIDDRRDSDVQDVIIERAAWENLWKRWKFTQNLPNIDWSKTFVIVQTSQASRIQVSVTVDDAGHANLVALETRDLRPGFRYVIQVLPRDGIKRIQGTCLGQPAGKGAQWRDRGQPVQFNINFGQHPSDGLAGGVIGKPHESWNLVEVGQTHLSLLKTADGQSSSVELEMSANDGVWGIKGQTGVYHSYLYHNCRCVDLQVKLVGLPPGLYEVFVVAHGDAPHQNAAVEIQAGSVTVQGKETLNDGSWDFRSRQWQDQNQYVKYAIDIGPNQPMLIKSKRAGSDYAMLNAIQLRRAARPSQPQNVKSSGNHRRGSHQSTSVLADR